ncbi:MAG: cytochrome c biogenesis protein CcsA [Thermoanaerobaculum sp.]|nr:cytochrome c biogenesis protein CcsA [Thermoanaerobaculum sp.]
MTNGKKVALALLFFWFCLVIWAAFFYAPRAVGFKGESARIVFFHVPQAWVAVLAFCVNLVASLRFLRHRHLLDDARAAAAARLGLLFAVLATISGSLFAKVMWGSFWNWDPREISIAILLLVYAAYFALRQAVSDPERRGSLAAAYAILAFVTMPFLVFVVPRIYWSLHPDTIISAQGTVRIQMDPRMFQVLLGSVLGFSGLFWWLYNLEVRLARLNLWREHGGE